MEIYSHIIFYKLVTLYDLAIYSGSITAIILCSK